MFAATCPAERTPVAAIVAAVPVTLHAGTTDVVVLSLHVAVAAYVPVAPSFTEEGPEIAMPESVGGTLTIVTLCDAVRVTPPEV